MRINLHATQLKINDFVFEWGRRTYLMGILNLTPDSFSGDGLLSAADTIAAALEQARYFVSHGADILDIGGESTRPGAEPVPIADEMARVIPVVRTLTEELNVLVSIDTYKSEVAEAALQAGAHMVNDVWGAKADPEIVRVAARHGAPIILMHNRSSWAHAELKERLGGRYIGVPYQDLLADIQRELLESAETALQAGVPAGRIILDPGIGFGKTVEQNLELLERLEEIRQLGYPVLLGPSRKSFIGFTLDAPPDRRLAGTAAAVAIGITRRADIIRVHDVEFMSQVVRMSDALVRRPGA